MKRGYDELLNMNKNSLTLDIVKEKLTVAYKLDDECKMANEITRITDICEASKNDCLA